MDGSTQATQTLSSSDAQNPDDSAQKPVASATSGILTEGENVWRIALADTATVLIDAEAYFGCLRAALLNARRSIYIAGWDIDTRTPLWPEDPAARSGAAMPADDLPVPLGAFLIELVKRRPDLEIKILLWDYSLIYAPDRELVPEFHLLWTTPPQIDLCLDDEIPVGSSHHQKIIVVDGQLAFCGGMDLTTKRWDTATHQVIHTARLDPRGIAYPPRHDVHMAVTGEAATVLSDLFRDRWRQAAREELLPVDATSNEVDVNFHQFSSYVFEAAEVGISRTIPPFNGREVVQEVQRLYLDQIRAAERLVYIESQYVTYDEVALVLAERMQAKPSLEVVIVCPLNYGAWVENNAMCAGRSRFLAVLQKAGVADRVSIVYPMAFDGEHSVPILVHSKLLIVDDTYLRIGSSNLCNRSMGADSECDLVLHANGREDHQRLIARTRNALIAEHLGLTSEDISEHLAAHGHLLDLVNQAEAPHRRLLPIPDDDDLVEWSLAGGIADPLKPIDARQLLLPRALHPVIKAEQPGSVSPEEPLSEDKAKFKTLILLALGVVLLAACWAFTPLAHLTRPDLWRGWLEHIRGPWELVAVIAVYVIAGFFAFPIVVLIALTAAIFGAWPGSLYAFTGAMASAIATYAIGRSIGRDSLRRFLGPRLNRVNEGLARAGIITTTIARLVPAAPYTLVNLAAGALRINFISYLIGTALGLAPGIIVMALLGRHIVWSIQHPTSGNVLILIVITVGAILLAIGFQQLTRMIRRRRHD